MQRRLLIKQTETKSVTISHQLSVTGHLILESYRKVTFHFTEIVSKHGLK